MDKNLLIDVLKSYYKGNITNNSLQVLQEYCLEHNKPIKETQLFIQALSQMPMLIGRHLVFALEYYKNKLNIIELKDKNNKLLNIY
jgi:hypothetical protein